MSIAGPSRLPPLRPFQPGARTKCTYEQELLGLLDALSLQERDEFQTSLKRRISAGGRLSDRDIALNDLIQQAHDLAAFDEDRMLAERIATAEDSDVDVAQEVAVETSRAAPESMGKRTRTKRKKKKRKQQGEVDHSPVETPQILAPPSYERSENKGAGNQQQSSPPLVSAWARGPPLSVLAASIKNEIRESLPKIGIKGKGKEQPGVQMVRNGASHPPWQTGVTPRLDGSWVFGSVNSGSSSTNPSSAPVITKAATLALGSPISDLSLPSVSNVRKTVKQPTGHDCVICQDPIYNAEIQAPCGHYYDITCVTDLFKSATRDETLFPPRCCKQNIPFTDVQPHLSQTLGSTFQEKEIEFGTLKRVYCSSPTCSRFLGPLSEGDSGSQVYACTASGCGAQTCGKCREKHSGDRTHICRPDAGATEVIELSRTSGWSRCPGCSQMIELNVGCFHMTCRCRTEFCYLCCAPWKTCPCRQWDEQRLLTAAEERVNAQLGNWEQVGRPRRDRQQERAPPILPDLNEGLVQRHWPALPSGGFRVLPPEAPNATYTPPVPAIMRMRSSTVSTQTSASGSVSGQGSRRTLVDVMRERMIREMMERLRIDHDCDHIQWRYQDSGGHCGHCGCYLPLYLFRCQDCEMLACNRCRRNRL